MKIEDERLSKELGHLASLLCNYGHYGQMTVGEGIAKSLNTSNPDYLRLAGIEMWGGAGAVWETLDTSSSASAEARADTKSFREAIIQLASIMDQLGIGTERSGFIARVFQTWLDKGI